jgi:hypothetical protein
MRFRAKLPVIDQLFLNKIYKLRRAAVRKNVDDRKNPKIFRTSRYPLRHGQFVRLFLQLSPVSVQERAADERILNGMETRRTTDATTSGKTQQGNVRHFHTESFAGKKFKKKKRLTWGNTRSFAGIKRKEKLHVLINLQKKLA